MTKIILTNSVSFFFNDAFSANVIVKVGKCLKRMQKSCLHLESVKKNMRGWGREDVPQYLAGALRNP